jgi:hypothetical protein
MYLSSLVLLCCLCARAECASTAPRDEGSPGSPTPPAQEPATTNEEAALGNILGQLEAMRGEISELRADREALTERVLVLENAQQCECETTQQATTTEPSPAAAGSAATDRAAAGRPGSGPDPAGSSLTRGLSPGTAGRQLAEAGSMCSTRKDLVAALERVENVCCTQAQETCAPIPGFEQHLPSSCAAAACACAVRQAAADCGHFLDQSADYATQQVKSTLDTAESLCVASPPQIATRSYAMQNTQTEISGCSGVITDGCGDYSPSPTGQRTTHIVTPDGWHPRLTPTGFSMAQHDNLRAYSGPDTDRAHSAPILVNGLESMTGKSTPPPFTATGNEMTLLEVTDRNSLGADTGSGYTLTLSCACDGCQLGTCVLNGVPEPAVCGNNGFCNAGTSLCECAPGFDGEYCDRFSSSCAAGAEWETQVDRVMDACCPADGGGGKRRGLQHQTCSLPETCPSLSCAAAFTTFFESCQTELTANAQQLPMDDFTRFNADCKRLQEPVDQGIPLGVIVQWSGAIDAIPNGWVQCDGANGTPDLRGKLLLGANDEHPAGEDPLYLVHSLACMQHRSLLVLALACVWVSCVVMHNAV